MISLLPPSAAPFERAIDITGAAAIPTTAAKAGALWNADNCPAELLGLLAWQLSIDLWDEAWPEVEKRNVCRNALKLHRLKTTLAGIKAHVALTGATVVKAVKPPARLFPTRGMTAAERENWLTTLPQLRLYPFDTFPLGSRRTFLSGPAGPRYFATAYPRASRGYELTGTRATLWDQGAETPIAYDQVDASTLRLRIPQKARGPFLGHGYWHGLFVSPSLAASGVVTLDVSGDLGGFAVASGMDPVSVEPTRIAEARTAPRARGYFGNALGRRWTMASWAPRQIYDRVSLNDPSRVPARRNGRVFLGHARLGFKPFRAELLISVPLTRSPQRAARYAGRGFLKGADLTGLSRAIQAVSVSKAARDTVLIDTVTARRVSFQDGLSFGSFTFGEIRKVA